MNRKGFTLIELLIVVVIIGILAAIAIPKFGESRKQAYISAMRSDLNQLRIAQEIYFNENDYVYASAVADIPNLTTSTNVTLVINAADGTAWDATATHSNAAGWSCTYDSEVGVIDCVEA